jgi:DNA modification methylase
MGKISDSNFPKFEERFKGAIESNYRTNLWNIRPQSNPDHPAVFPLALAKAVIMCYSGKGSKVLDPFGGSGTTAQACEEIGDRIYLLIERKKEYYDLIMQNLSSAQPGLCI